MTPLRGLGAALLATLVSTAPAHAAVNVSFDQPSRYTDASDWNHDGLDTLRELRDHLQRLGQRHLPPGYTLDVSIQDVKLAGSPRWTSGVNPEVRVLTGDADWPWIELSYTLRAGERRVASGHERIVDRSYLRRIDGSYTPTTPLPYEKRMLDEWFDATFGSLKSPPSH